LWQGQSPTKSRKGLRQALWRLKGFLENTGEQGATELVAEMDWIQFIPSNNWWLDTADFESTFAEINARRVRELSEADFHRLQEVVKLYQGDLLEGWYQDWCLIERERFQAMYLMCLDKLVQYCEVHHHYDAGLVYAADILRCDQAYERTHRQMMRLYYMSGARTQALHQYQRCQQALRKDLDIGPSDRTRQLHEQIRADNFTPPVFALGKVDLRPETAVEITNVLNQLEQVSEILNKIEYQVQQEIQALTSTLLRR